MFELCYPFPTYNKSVADDLENILSKMRKISINECFKLLNKVETLWLKEKLLVLSNFFCHIVFQSPAAEASESVYMWEGLKSRDIDKQAFAYYLRTHSIGLRG